MSERLDELIARLAATADDRALGDLEVEIGRSILLRRREARTASALAPVRVASVGLALSMGIAAGGSMAVSAIIAPHAYGTFSTIGHLAPSTLLEGGE